MDGTEWSKIELDHLIASDFLGRPLSRSHEWSRSLITQNNRPVLVDTYGDLHKIIDNDDMVVRFYTC